jgi:hypothetical protein
MPADTSEVVSTSVGPEKYYGLWNWDRRSIDAALPGPRKIGRAFSEGLLEVAHQSINKRCEELEATLERALEVRHLIDTVCQNNGCMRIETVLPQTDFERFDRVFDALLHTYRHEWNSWQRSVQASIVLYSSQVVKV